MLIYIYTYDYICLYAYTYRYTYTPILYICTHLLTGNWRDPRSGDIGASDLPGTLNPFYPALTRTDGR